MKSIIASLFIMVWAGQLIASNPVTKDTDVKKDKTAVIQLTKNGFLEKVMDYETNQQEWVYKGDKPCIIDFYADWCGPCKITSPILDELSKEYEGQIYVYKVNVDNERELSSVFGIRGIPAFLYCPMDGKPSMTSGIARSNEETKKMFKDNIDKLLLKQ